MRGFPKGDLQNNDSPAIGNCMVILNDSLFMFTEWSGKKILNIQHGVTPYGFSLHL